MNKWIHIKNGLPYDQQKVLIYVPTYDLVCAAIFANSIFHSFAQSCQTHLATFELQADVSHWQPLPCAPKEKN